MLGELGDVMMLGSEEDMSWVQKRGAARGWQDEQMSERVGKTAVVANAEMVAVREEAGSKGAEMRKGQRQNGD